MFDIVTRLPLCSNFFFFVISAFSVFRILNRLASCLFIKSIYYIHFFPFWVSYTQTLWTCVRILIAPHSMNKARQTKTSKTGNNRIWKESCLFSKTVFCCQLFIALCPFVEAPTAFQFRTKIISCLRLFIRKCCTLKTIWQHSVSIKLTLSDRERVFKKRLRNSYLFHSEHLLLCCIRLEKHSLT